MEIEIDYTKSAQDNAQEYFEKAKEAEHNAKGAEKAIKNLEIKMKELEKTKVIEKKLKEKQNREWYEKFNWFFTSSGLLAIGGRSAQQNDEINVKYFSDNDLFFHASIFGASAVILKDGANADDKVKQEVAQFAACYSSAWDNGQSIVDVFAAKRGQVSKSSGKGHVAAGSFIISGDREWFKGVRLELCAFISKSGNENKLSVAPELTCRELKIGNAVALRPGPKKKSDAAKAIMAKLVFEDLDYIMQHLPAGGFSLSVLKA